MKEQNYIPEFMRKAHVTTIYKGKGDKFDLVNERGIFLVTVLRSILMKLIYMDNYQTIDKNMSDSQVGARKSKNVRNHIWIVNGIIRDVLTTKKKTPIDIQIFDYRQCFDSLWLSECLNDIYESGLKDDKLALIYDINSKVNFRVKTPVGLTNSEAIENVICQGDVFGPILCSNQVDTFGKECLEHKKYTYMYKGEVEIPPLGMVDDLLCVSECGHKTTMLNTFINFKSTSKKLQFGVEKCKKLHVGSYQRDYKCQNLYVDKWSEKPQNVDSNCNIEIRDIFDGEHAIEEKDDEKYLGDVISTNGRNISNIKARVSKGNGIIKKILIMLEGIPVGNKYFEIAIILRDSLLISSVLFNSEAWYNITESELNLLESIDISFLRQLLRAPKATPKEMLYLELGCKPLRDLLRERRLSFFHYLLNEDEKSMVNRFFWAQIRGGFKKDWTTTVVKDLEYIGFEYENLDVIKNMKKEKFMKIVKEKNSGKIFERLLEMKSNHSKVKEIEYKEIAMQDYLKSSKESISKKQAWLIFRLRCRVTSVKMNMKSKYEELNCRACNLEEESQSQILQCKQLNEGVPSIISLEGIFKGNLLEKIQIAKKFEENFGKLENEFVVPCHKGSE